MRGQTTPRTRRPPSTSRPSLRLTCYARCGRLDTAPVASRYDQELRPKIRVVVAVFLISFLGWRPQAPSSESKRASKWGRFPSVSAFSVVVQFEIMAAMATLTKGVDLAFNMVDCVVHALSDGMPIQLKRMRASGSRGSISADQDGLGQHGADLEIASQSNGSY